MATGPELDSLLSRFVKFLQDEKLASKTKLESLTLSQLKTAYNLRFKHSEALCGSLPVVTFEELQNYALKHNKLIVQGNEITFPSMGVKVANRHRPDFRKVMDNIADKRSKVELKRSKTKTTKVRLDPAKMTYSAVVLQLGFDRDLVLSAMELQSPAIFFVMNTNLDDSVALKALHVDGYQHFRQNVVNGPGGILIYVNSLLEPVFLEELSTKTHESVWLKLKYPDVIAPPNGQRAAVKPTVIVGCMRDDSTLEFTSCLFKSFQKALLTYPNASVLLVCNYNRTNLDQLKKSVPSLRFESVDMPIDSRGRQGFLVAKSGIFSNGKVELKKPLQPPNNLTQIMTMTNERLRCSACSEAFLSQETFKAHCKSDRHRRNFFAFFFKERRPQLVASKHNMDVEVVGPAGSIVKEDLKNGVITCSTKLGIKINLELKITNMNSTDEQKLDPTTGRKMGMILKSICLLSDSFGFSLSDKYGFCKPPNERPDMCKSGVRIQSGQSLNFIVTCVRSEIGQYKMPVFVTFQKEGSEQLETMAREILLKVSNSDVDSMKPKQPYERPKPVSKRSMPEAVEYGLPLEKEEKSGFKSTFKLDHYPIKSTLRNVLMNGFKQSPGMDKQTEEALATANKLIEAPLAYDNYFKRFSLLLHCEEQQMKLDIRNYDMEQVKMVARGPRLLVLDVPGLAENRPSVLKGDKLLACVYASPSAGSPENRTYEGYIHEVEETRVLIGFSPKLRNRFIDNMRFDIQFTINRFPLRNMHRSAEYVATHPELKDFAFPEDKTHLIPDRSKLPPLAFGPLVSTNKEQQTAVENIVRGGMPGVPYIIFGPPGTGKTVTITEAIFLIWKTREKSHVLAAAPSNSAADHLTSSLLKRGIPKTQILRFYAPSRVLNAVPEELRDVSNFKRTDTSLEKLKEYRIIVVTLVTAGRLASASFPSDHFNHVFIDEAGHATEPEAFIPVSGILSKTNGQLVLAGDPKQLGPVLRSPISLACGLDKSLLERLMKTCDLYKKDDDTGKFNPHTVTKLLKNFRSHESLLTLPSAMFYDSELIAAADELKVNNMIGWEKLPNRKIPMIFHGIVGEDQREQRSPSYFNPEEAAMVVQYLDDLLESGSRQGVKKKVLPVEIGIISPYRRQVQKIKELMNRKLSKKFPGGEWKKITVGSTEEFQGQERRIMIISTVRSKPELLQADFQHKLGFLKNPKRFNVAITRAKALMIVIGNPFLLSVDEHWKRFLDFVYEEGCYKGVDYVPFKSEEEKETENGFVQIDENALKAKLDLEQVEKKFREMGLHQFDGFSANPQEEKLELDDISQAEYQQGLIWRAEH